MDDFASSFDDADMVIVTDIYAAREPNTGEVHAQMLVDKISARGKKVFYIPGFDNIVAYLNQNASSGDLVITMGAGTITRVAEAFIRAC